MVELTKYVSCDTLIDGRNSMAKPKIPVKGKRSCRGWGLNRFPGSMIDGKLMITSNCLSNAARSFMLWLWVR